MLTGPVDHCDARGCSHKCAYDYDTEDYKCTCPPALFLSDNERTCAKRPAITDESDSVPSSTSSSTTQSSIKVELLPTDCLWSEWSDWSDCTATCGESAVSSRTRKVIIPARYVYYQNPSKELLLRRGIWHLLLGDGTKVKNFLTLRLLSSILAWSKLKTI